MRFDNVPPVFKKQLDKIMSAIKKLTVTSGDSIIKVTSDFTGGWRVSLNMYELKRRLSMGGGGDVTYDYATIAQTVTKDTDTLDGVWMYVIRPNSDTAPNYDDTEIYGTPSDSGTYVDWHAGSWATDSKVTYDGYYWQSNTTTTDTPAKTSSDWDMTGNGIDTVWATSTRNTYTVSDRWALVGDTAENAPSDDNDTEWEIANWVVMVYDDDAVPDWREYVPYLVAGQEYPVRKIGSYYYFDSEFFTYVGDDANQSVGVRVTSENPANTSHNKTVAGFCVVDGAWGS